MREFNVDDGLVMSEYLMFFPHAVVASSPLCVDSCLAAERKMQGSMLEFTMMFRRCTSRIVLHSVW